MEYVFTIARLLLFLVPLVAAAFAGRWLAKSWRQFGSGEVAGRALVIGVGGVVMAYAALILSSSNA